MIKILPLTLIPLVFFTFYFNVIFLTDSILPEIENLEVKNKSEKNQISKENENISVILDENQNKDEPNKNADMKSDNQSKELEKTDENKKFNDVFYPLGVISDTRNFAKKRKIVQVQFSLPIKNENKIQYLIDMLIDGQTPILCSVKRLTHNESNLNFSFVQDGWTFAVDFPYETFNKKTIRKFYSELIKQEGKVYLAKDISLNEEEFKSMYPNYRDWLMVVKGVDPDKKFQSEMSVRLGLKKW